MKNYLYVMFNTLSKRFGEVVCFPSDGFAIARCKEKIPDTLRKEVNLCRVGSINIETGEVIPETPKHLDWIEENLPVSEAE